MLKTCFGLVIIADQHIVGLQVAVDQGLAARLLVVKVAKARRDALSDLVVRMSPVVVEIVLGCGHQELFERAALAELEHEAELVGAVFPAPSHETDEVVVREWRHELQLAHEIAHVTQRHISRALYANQKASILTMAALLGAILVGIAGGVDGEIVQGAVAASQGIAIQQQIGFTRSNESEADRVGVGVLANAGYDPMGMPDFFETMGRITGSSGSQIPEFLRSHPVSTDRVAESRARAEQYPELDRSDTIGYSLTKARVRLMTTGRPDVALNYFINEQTNPEHVGDIGIEYGIALSMLEMNDYEGAREQFAELVEINEEIIHFYTGLAQAQMGLGDRQTAFATYEQAVHLFPRNVPLTVRYSEALVQYGDPGLAHEVLLDLLNQVPPTPEQVRLIAIAANAAGDTADAHYYMAEYHLLNGDLRMAVDQLRLALGIPGLESVQRARFLARLEHLLEIMPSQARQRGQSRD